MVVKIRLSRFGNKRQPFYNIVVSQARTARDSKPMEVIGTYDPLPRTPLATADGPEDDSSASNSQENNQVHSEGQHRQQQSNDPVTGLPRTRRKYKDIRLDQSRTKYWLGVGAQPSEPVERLLCMIGLMPPRPGKSRASNQAYFPSAPVSRSN